MPWVQIMKSSCVHCGGSCFWQDCPTGGWWIHDSLVQQHNHDAEGQPEDVAAVLERERAEDGISVG